MLPGVDQKAMKAAMKKMGMKQEEIPADVVIIKSSGKDIIIENPQVLKVNMMGQESFQITGNVNEKTIDTKIEISEDDVEIVKQKSGKSSEDSRKALEEANGDIAQAILNLES